MKTLIFVMLVLSQEMFASSCVMQGLDEAVRRADYIFTGRISDIVNVAGPDDKAQTIHAIVTYDISGYWKGDVGRKMTLSVLNQPSEDRKSYTLQKGDVYLVFASKEHTIFWLRSFLLAKRKLERKSLELLMGNGLVNRDLVAGAGDDCSRTRLISEAGEDLKLLGPAKLPAK
ncbi:MAG: hypothetical protein AAB392_00110 [Patescibacteria group bacterium]